MQTTIENLQRRPGRFTCIAHVRGHHFVNIAEIDGGEALVIDPPREYTLPLDTLRSQWDGTALLISSAPLLREDELPHPQGRTLVIIGIVSVLTLVAIVLFLRRQSRTGTGAS